MKVLSIRIVSALAMSAFLALNAAAQRPDPKPGTPPPPPGQPVVVAVAEPCPALQVRSNTGQLVREGTPVQFVASLTGNVKTQPTYSWSISSGVITLGQGTNTIQVDSTGSGADKAITASVLISGFAAECPYMSETTVKVAGPARKVHEYGEVTDEQQERWLDSLTAALQPEELAYVIVYAGRETVRGAAQTELKKIRTHVLKGGTAGDRFVTIDGGYRETSAHEFWIVPMGAEAPRPSPTIAARDIVFPKPVKAPKKP